MLQTRPVTVGKLTGLFAVEIVVAVFDLKDGHGIHQPAQACLAFDDLHLDHKIGCPEASIIEVSINGQLELEAGSLGRLVQFTAMNADRRVSLRQLVVQGLAHVHDGLSLLLPYGLD